jgi:serine/threonine protein kinase
MGPASDVYSLGAVLYELLTDRTPFQGDVISLMEQITAGEPEPPSAYRAGLDPRLDALCLRALARRPAGRWPSRRDLADAFGQFLTPGPSDGPAEGAGPGAPALCLRIEGTPYAYRPAPGQEVITLGRQRRKPGQPPGYGNDVVLRVPGNDPLSARISRRHLEIDLRGGGFVVTDRSTGGTLHNGRPLLRDVPTPWGRATGSWSPGSSPSRWSSRPPPRAAPLCRKSRCRTPPTRPTRPCWRPRSAT